MNIPAHARDAWSFIVDGRPCEWWQEQKMVPENPDYREPIAPGFRVAIPVTGGMDSSTLWMMALEAGLPVEPVYVDVGQSYRAAEMAAVLDVLGVEPEVLYGPTLGDGWKHVILGRNWHAIAAIAHWMTSRGLWGELWFGNLAGETPTVGGDKSSRFFTTTQHLLTMLGHDVQLHSPLRGLDKTDLVRWWAARGKVHLLARTKSCLHPSGSACGRCQTCFRKMVAFEAAGYGDALTWDHTPDWAPFVEKYSRVMCDTPERYSPARIADTLAVIARL